MVQALNNNDANKIVEEAAQGKSTKKIWIFIAAIAEDTKPTGDEPS